MPCGGAKATAEAWMGVCRVILRTISGSDHLQMATGSYDF